MTNDDQTTQMPPAEAPPTQATPTQALPTEAPPVDTRQTVRWGALVWALVFATIAGTTLWVLVSPERRDDVARFLLELDPVLGALYAVVAIGLLIALFGIVGLIRRGERSRRAG